MGAAPGAFRSRSINDGVRPSDLDGVDADGRVRLAMSLRPTVVLALLVLEDADLVVPPLFEHGARHRGGLEQGRADLRIAAPAHHQHLAERDLVARSRLQPVDVHGVALLNPDLPPTRPDDRVHAHASLTETRRN